MSLVNQRFMFGPDGSLTPIDDDEVVEEWVIEPCAIDWFGMGAGASGVAVPDPGYGPTTVTPVDTPPRHSADDYRAIAERLKQLGYRGWITG